MMNTPICDFVADYSMQNNIRLHMPGHKGIAYLGCEGMDITEIVGADSLYDAEGIIRESELNASSLFGCRSFYSTEGSSLAIRAMLALACQYARESGRAELIWAGRNAHSTFISAAALLDFSVEWLYSDEGSYLSCPIKAEAVENKLGTARELPTAIYITSPDYLGNQANISDLAGVCRKYGVLLLVDNAHGAYLKFLPDSKHPIELGADICCDSAHKSLPVLTGGAYLHLSPSLSALSDGDVKEAMRLFGSTSPSYLILQSLDMANRYLAEEYRQRLGELLPLVLDMKERLCAYGYRIVGSEPLKLSLEPKSYGYRGTELAALLAEKNIIAEFFDSDYIVLMLTPSLAREDIDKITESLLGIPRKSRIEEPMPIFSVPKLKMTIREAMLERFELLPIEECLGRTLARASVSCPPAVPILVSGEEIDENSISCFRYYGIKYCKVTRE